MRAQATVDITHTECLSVVEQLSRQIASSVAAIALNDVEVFEKQIESQQKLCAELLALRDTPDRLPATAAARAALQCALQALMQNTRVYAKVLAASGRSQHVLLTLCKAYKHSSTHTADQQPMARTLSCEV